MSAKFCGKCGSPLEEGSTFCANCGWKIVAPNEQSPVAKLVQPQFQQQVEPHYQQPQQPSYVPPQPLKKKSGCGGCLLMIILIVVLAAGAFLFGGKFIAAQLDKMGIDTSSLKLPKIHIPGVELPNLFGSDFKAKDISGPYLNEFETLTATVNGATDTIYASMIGEKINVDSSLAMTDDKSGFMTFSEDNYLIDTAAPMALILKGDQVDIVYEDRITNTKMHYKGTLSKENERHQIIGTYESIYTHPTSGTKVVITGNWKAFSTKGVISKNLDLSKAKKEVTIDQLQGTWIGDMVYTKIENLDEIPDISESDKAIARDVIGKSSGLYMKFEGNQLTMTIKDPIGGESDIEDFPAITLEDGVFTTAFFEMDDEGAGQMNVSAVVYEEGGQLKIKGELKMEIMFAQGKKVTMIVDLASVKDAQ